MNNAALTPGVLLFLAAWPAVAAVFAGLWLGELRLNRALERMLAFGNPVATKGKAVTRLPSAEAEDRMSATTHVFSKQTVSRIAEHFLKAAHDQGYDGYTADQARIDAELALAGQDVEPPPV